MPRSTGAAESQWERVGFVDQVGLDGPKGWAIYKSSPEKMPDDNRLLEERAGVIVRVIGIKYGKVIH